MRKKQPLYEQIYTRLREDILQGYLRKGDALPSIRRCEQLFSVSRTSVEKAYEKLMEEGYIRIVAQSGCYVDVDADAIALRLAVLRQKKQASPRIRYDMRSQTMEAELLNTAVWKRYIRSVLEQKELLATYGDPQGEEELRLALQRYAYTMRGVLCQSEQILVGGGIQALLYSICALLPKTTIVGLSEPVYLPIRQVFADLGFSIVTLAQDEQGISLEEVRRKKVTLLYINSGAYTSRQTPLQTSQQKALLAWAREHNAWLLEDDHNGELRYHSRLLPAMQGMEPKGQVLYLGSFSRLLPPSLRISYAVLPSVLLSRYQERMHAYAPTAGKLEQLALAYYIRDGHMQRHVRRLLRRYAEKSRLMLTLCRRIFSGMPCRLEEAALSIRVTLPCKVAAKLLTAAEKEGILLEREQETHIRLSFAGIREEDMEKALLRVYELYKEACYNDEQER